MTAGTIARRTRHRASPWLIVGLALTAAVAIHPFVDAATMGVLARHIGAGYPGYTSNELATAQGAYLAILALVGTVGAVLWIVVMTGVSRGGRWVRFVASAALTVGVLLSAAALTTLDTSGETGLAPLFGWSLLLPCVPGAVAVALLWRDSPTRLAE